MTPYTLQSILPLYLGQKILIEESCYNWVHEHSWHKMDKVKVSALLIHTLTNKTITPKFKLILRPLSSMTEEEKNEYRREFKNITSENLLPEISAGRMVNHFVNKKDPFIILWLLSKGFDIFGLKEKGLCLYPEEL